MTNTIFPPPLIFLSLLFAKKIKLAHKTWVAKCRRWPYDKLVNVVALIINF